MNLDLYNAGIGLVLVSAQLSNVLKIYKDKALVGHTIYNCSINVISDIGRIWYADRSMM